MRGYTSFFLALTCFLGLLASQEAYAFGARAITASPLDGNGIESLTPSNDREEVINETSFLISETVSSDISASGDITVVTPSITIVVPSLSETHETGFSASVKQQLFSEIKTLQGDVTGNRHDAALATLRLLQEQIRDNQSTIAGQYFPVAFGDFKRVASDLGMSDLPGLGDAFGVLFSGRLENDENQSLGIFVVYQDPSIEEYRVALSQPNIGRAEHVSVVTVQEKYKALQKFSPDEKLAERNIIVHDQLMVNVVSTGLDSLDMIEAFCEAVDFEGLAGFLE